MNAHKNSIDNGNDVVEHGVKTEEESVKNGYFEESYDDGSSYKGNFKDGLYHDWGTFIWANGEKYEGKWNKGNRVKGTYTWPEKRKNYMYKYVGEFKNNKFEGEGTAYFVGGETWSGLWKNGEFVESQSTSIADINDESQPTSIPDINDFATSKDCYEQTKKLRLNGQGEKAIEFCLKAYRIGESPYNGWALHQIGCIYYFGLGGIKNNYYEGFRYFKMASDIGVLPSKYYLGICYRYGRGVQQDGSKAKELISASGYTSPPGYDF
ncbi:MAG: SEL1-like repeat protein [Bacteroidales bacterium]|nr:SEL1-like repeat protein [Bacteroidales bacterium]